MNVNSNYYRIDENINEMVKEGLFTPCFKRDSLWILILLNEILRENQGLVLALSYSKRDSKI